MRIFFFVILLCNIIFFLWEFNSRPIKVPKNIANDTAKQILLLSELPKKTAEEVPVVANNKPKLNMSDNFKPKYEKFALDTSIESLAINFNDLKLASNIFDNSDKNRADFLKALDVESQDNVKVALNLDPQQKNSEMTNQDKELAGETSKIKQDIVAEQKNCYQVGPFLEEKALIDWIKLNNLDEDTVTRFNQEIKTVTNYLVYYPRAETYALSKKNAQIFKNKGINDFWLFRKGALKGVFSLGLLKKEKRALWLQKQLAKKGLNTEIMPRYKTQSVWYAKIFSKKVMTDETMAISEKQSLSSCDNI